MWTSSPSKEKPQRQRNWLSWSLVIFDERWDQEEQIKKDSGKNTKHLREWFLQPQLFPHHEEIEREYSHVSPCISNSGANTEVQSEHEEGQSQRQQPEQGDSRGKSQTRDARVSKP
jgi:hypothetical protein